jgi:hypothetical protein
MRQQPQQTRCSPMRIIHIRGNVRKNLPAISSRAAQFSFATQHHLSLIQHLIAAVRAYECHHQIAVFVA